MKFRQMKTEELALLLHGLRAIFVADSEDARQKLMAKIESELSIRGCALAA